MAEEGSSVRVLLDIAVFDDGDFDVEIDAIEQRTGNTLSITVDLGRSALAFAFQIAEIAAGARVHRGHEHELGWEGDAAGGAGDRDFPVFERMTVSPLMATRSVLSRGCRASIS
jgi:hypothetical protein